MVLQQYVREGTTVLDTRKKSRMFQKKARTQVVIVKMLQVWIFSIFHDNVWHNVISDLSGLCRCKHIARGYQAILDFQSTMEMGIFR